MSRWEQILEYFPLHVLLIGWLYARWLRVCRWLRYLLGSSSRAWCAPDSMATQVRVVE
jgi:hypothetical protein